MVRQILIHAFLCIALVSRAWAELQCTLADPIVMGDEEVVTMEQVANREAGTFSMRLTYYGGQSWIGIGINQAGRGRMTPATAVIGRMLEDGTPSVLKYDLMSDDKDGSGVIPMTEDLQNLVDARFSQTETESVLEFTQSLNDVKQQVTDDSVWIWAVGLPNNQWEGRHAIDGAFTLSLSENCVDVPDTTTTTTSPGTTTSSTDSSSGGSTTTTTTAGPQDMTTTTTSSPHGTTTTEASSSEGNDSASSGNPNSSTSGQGITQFQDASEATRPLWIAHGFLMAIAWGICAPLAIGAVLLRGVSLLAQGGRWYTIHFYLNIANVLLTSIGFFLAVAAIHQEGEEHFTENTHEKAGLAIFFIVLFQFVLAFLRPSPPKAASQSVKSVEHRSSEVTMTTDNGSPSRASLDHAVAIDSEGSGSGVEIEEESVAPPVEIKQPATTKSKIRLAWEISHRFIGVTLIGLAWYNCDSGIQLMVESYEESDDLSAVFWGVTGGISGLLFFLSYVVRV